MTMTLQATFSDVKIDSIVLHILNEYNFTPLTILFTDYLKKKHSTLRNTNVSSDFFVDILYFLFKFYFLLIPVISPSLGPGPKLAAK